MYMSEISFPNNVRRVVSLCRIFFPWRLRIAYFLRFFLLVFFNPEFSPRRYSFYPSYDLQPGSRYIFDSYYCFWYILFAFSVPFLFFPFFFLSYIFFLCYWFATVLPHFLLYVIVYVILRRMWLCSSAISLAEISLAKVTFFFF